ncbi:MAG TPA: hypothetical protein VK922_03130 [Gemmatimonadaceae bacterium]|nr:hypothetical protein [Gemmatimonadaceae bacterium]
MGDVAVLIPIFGILGGVGIVSVLTWAHVQQQKLKHGGGPTNVEGLHERLARIENAIDAMSVEVERISEGQRFTTRLLSERGTDRPDAATPGA